MHFDSGFSIGKSQHQQGFPISSWFFGLGSITSVHPVFVVEGWGAISIRNCNGHLHTAPRRWRDQVAISRSGTPAAVCGGRFVFLVKWPFGPATTAVSFDWNQRYHKRQEEAVICIQNEGYVKDDRLARGSLVDLMSMLPVMPWGNAMAPAPTHFKSWRTRFIFLPLNPLCRSSISGTF